ncbi:MAG: hypothetical protein WC415_05725 [Patescibacteria group bacterium]|jgi:predicted GH43/DUF377 family glycosyl hydrolase
MFKLKKQGNGPIFQPDSKLKWENEGVFNPGIVKLGKEIVMLYRAVGEKHSYISHLGLAKSRDGHHFTRCSTKPIFGPSHNFDKWGVEDPRITKIGSYFYITYVAVSKRIMKDGQAISYSPPLETAVALLRTKNFSSYENIGVISPKKSDNKDTVLFPKKIKGRYCLLHRPNHWTKEWFAGSYEKYVHDDIPCSKNNLPKFSSIWIAWSDDLKKWDDHHLLFEPSQEKGIKIGPGLPPIETKDGWLIIYHHVEKDSRTKKLIYSVRVALLDLKNPEKIISQLPYDILQPKKTYETESNTSVVFPTGGFVSKKNILYVYYGAADRYVCLATGPLDKLLLEFKKPANKKT